MKKDTSEKVETVIEYGGKQEGLYIRETSRCLFERSNEHLDGVIKCDESNFIVKHWAITHKDLSAPPRFKFSVLQTHRDPMTRLVHESVLIETDSTLNSKDEWGRSKRPRLRIE